VSRQIAGLERSAKRPRFRLVQSPDDREPYLAGAQIWLGRQLGRLVLRHDRATERLRIQHSQLAERRTAPRTIAGLMRTQRGFIGALLTLLVGVAVIDELLHYLGHHIVKVVSWHAFLARHLDLPSTQTLHDALMATAAATGTIFGLVITVSLIVSNRRPIATAVRASSPFSFASQSA